MVTAAQEFQGQSVAASISANYRLRLPFGPGGARFYSLTPTVGSLKVLLPKALTYLAGTGVGHLFTIHNASGTNSLTITAHDATTVVGTLAVGQVAQVYLVGAGTDVGTWVMTTTAGTLGTSMTLGRQPWSLTFAQVGASTINLREALDARGYDGVSPVALTCTVSAVRGSGDNTLPALDSGTFPAGSTLFLVISANARLAGKGGGGADGGNTPSGSAPNVGEAGGPALTLRLNTALVNLGTIAGGGGGGGGGQASATAAGGGGGGGAGYVGGTGGAPGVGGGASRGVDGGISTAGGGGGSAGGNGGNGGLEGAAGTAGSGTGGSAGGAAGSSIRKLTGITLNKIRAGTITGTEVFF